MNTIEFLRSRPGYLSVVEAAEYLSISRDTLCDWINAGTIKAYRLGNANKIDRLYLADWLEERALAPAWPTGAIQMLSGHFASVVSH
jgi:excisionase family DNA binding protein